MLFGECPGMGGGIVPQVVAQMMGRASSLEAGAHVSRGGFRMNVEGDSS